MDDIFVINEDNGNDDRNVSASFDIVPMVHSARSKAAGRAVYTDTPMVFIRVRDDETGSKIPQLVTEEIKQRFPREWAAFEASHQVVDGMPLRMWPPITPSKLMEFTAAGILSVEQLAEASDVKIGPEAEEWRARAKQWLAPQSEIEDLRSQLAAAQAERRGPGRPRKEEAA